MSDKNFTQNKKSRKSLKNNIKSNLIEEINSESINSFSEQNIISKNKGKEKNINFNDSKRNSKSCQNINKKDYYILYEDLKKHETKLRREIRNEEIKNYVENRLNLEPSTSPILDIIKKKQENNSLNNTDNNFNNLDSDDSCEINELTDKGIDCDNYTGIFEVIKHVKIPPKKRNMNDLLIIVKYLISTSLGKYFREEFENKKLYEKLITFCGAEMKYKLFKKGETIFKIGDIPDYFYIILYGKVNVMKPLSKKMYISGFQYFCYLMNLKKCNEKYLFDLCIKDNRKNFHIQKDDVEKLPYIFLVINLEDIQRHVRKNFKKILNLTSISCEELNLDPSKIENDKYIYDHIGALRKKFIYINSSILSHYSFINDQFIQKEIILYDYTKFLELETKEYFGDSAMDINTYRNATTTTEEDTHVGYITNSLYYKNVVVEKLLIIEKKIEFLHSNYYFCKIHQKKFEKKYFGFFIYEQFKKGEIIFSENEFPKYVYFIEEGTLELYSSKNILQIEIVISNLEKRIQEIINKKNNYYFPDEDEFKLAYNKINNDGIDLLNQINKSDKNKIFVVQKNEDLGILSFFFGFPYLTNCIVNSNNAKIYKIEFKYLTEIMLKEKDCYRDLQNRIERKLKLYHERFFNINNVKIVLADNKITKEKKKMSKSHSCAGIFDNKLKNNLQILNSNALNVNYDKMKEVFNNSFGSNKNNDTSFHDKKTLPLIKTKNNINPFEKTSYKNLNLYQNLGDDNISHTNYPKHYIRNFRMLNMKNTSKNFKKLNRNKFCKNQNISFQNEILFTNKNEKVLSCNNNSNHSSTKHTNFSMLNNISFSKNNNFLFNYNNNNSKYYKNNNLMNSINRIRYKSFNVTNDNNYNLNNPLNKVTIEMNKKNIDNKKHNNSIENIVNINQSSLNDNKTNQKNNPFISPLVLSKKEKYSIFVNDEFYDKKEKYIKEKIKENYKSKGLNEFGFPVYNRNFVIRKLYRNNLIKGNTFNFRSMNHFEPKRKSCDK